MIRSIFSAISGMRAQQTFMDVVGNNIANVNTTGYKAARITFEDMLSQTYQGAAAADANRGSTNAGQIGLGSKVEAVGMMTAAGNLQATQSPTDLAIQGQGYFVLGNANGQGAQIFTRDGSFTMGSDGSLVAANGLHVLGWAADPVTGLVNQSTALTSLKIPVGDPLATLASSKLDYTGNLNSATDANAPPPANSVVTSVTMYDSLGQSHPVSVTFTKTNNSTDAWSWAASTTEVGVSVAGSGTMTFDPATGAFKGVPGSKSDGTISLTVANGAKSPQSVDLSFAGLTQLGSATSANGSSDGQAPGSLADMNVDSSGVVTGIYSNGVKRVIGQVAMGEFANPQGLVRQGGNDFSSSAASGNPIIGAASSGGRGQISSGYLEMSNVDLTQEFSNMIMAERGFEASSRVITVSDQLLQTLVNLKTQ